MLRYLVSAEAQPGYRLYLVFRDGMEGVAELANHIDFDGTSASLRDFRKFAEVVVDTELDAVVWPCGTSFHAEILYGLVAERASPMP